ncbi:hypothetical protein GCM10009122_23170 [Fulvivirga kasyanovii]|uniref:LPXTG cell wall anchor domain-containing protein n=1 Tax=Fulvivirga kasyanovii TaxID=396812 RepID=A0ABW9RZ08_9BACT|nr:hypothetical protein [Fulvivirga kasyanovii]MTI28977.1 hypothetical protein [Fulvivirga kasyanovii]
MNELMEPPLELRVYGEEDFYDDEFEYDHFLKKLRRKIKKKGLFKSVVSLGAPSLLLKKKLLKKKSSSKKSAPEATAKPPEKKAPTPESKMPVKKLTGQAEATPKAEHVRAQPKQELVKQQVTSSATSSMDDLNPDDSLPEETGNNRKILVAIAVVAGVVVLVKVVQRFKQQPVS